MYLSLGTYNAQRTDCTGTHSLDPWTLALTPCTGNLQSWTYEYSGLIALVGCGGPEDVNIDVFGIGNLQYGDLHCGNLK